MIHLDGVSTAAGPFKLEGIELQVPTGSYAVLMGATGCGKTTLLEAICGLAPIGRGRVILGGTDVTHLSPADRNIGYVPQDGALFPHMSVEDHLAFGPKVRGWGKAEIAEQVERMALELGIVHLLSRRPLGLSGGERQRVALGRALASRPKTLLLDEPLSAVDEQTRDGLCDLLGTLPRASNVTVLHVTHSAAEAERLASQRLQMQATGDGSRIQDVTATSPPTSARH